MEKVSSTVVAKNARAHVKMLIHPCHKVTNMLIYHRKIKLYGPLDTYFGY